MKNINVIRSVLDTFDKKKVKDRRISIPFEKKKKL